VHAQRTHRNLIYGSQDGDLASTHDIERPRTGRHTLMLSTDRLESLR
jgi:hypothetical protein